jgi:hypothetical protein
MGQSLLEILLFMILLATILFLVSWGGFQQKSSSDQFTRHLPWLRKNNWPLLAILSIVFILAIVSITQLVRDSNRIRVYGGIYSFLDNQITENQMIAYFDSPRNYLFYGKNLDKLVLHRLPITGDPDKWINTLQQDGAKFIATGPLNKSSDSSREGQFIHSLIVKRLLYPRFGKDPISEIVIFRLPTGHLN